jgi:hypothetical protein
VTTVAGAAAAGPAKAHVESRQSSDEFSALGLRARAYVSALDWLSVDGAMADFVAAARSLVVSV